MRQDIARQLGKRPGDSVHITLRLDTSERVAELADDIETALAGAGLPEVFRTYSYTHQREYLQWVREAKRAETRRARIEKMLTMLSGGHPPR